MNKENLFLIGLVILVAGGLIYALSGFFEWNNPNTGTSNDIGASNNIGTSDDIGASNNIPSQSNFQTKTSESTVTIDLTPKEFKDGKLYVDIGVNTHTVDLSTFDLKELTTLELGDNSIKPGSALSLTGHHNSGTLIFSMEEEPEEFIIKIKGVPKIEERVFRWP